MARNLFLPGFVKALNEREDGFGIFEAVPFIQGFFFCLSRFVFRAVSFPIKVTLNSLMPYRIQMQQAAVYLQDGNKILTVDDFSAGLIFLFLVFLFF
ncbi:hypothetical protein Barb6XT_01944 [Bacteroidales bacterium Barb6XT]|nr:hypothetical protein Barb6XT_01944 [Bacteroidales bacterium Barb6XT]